MKTKKVSVGFSAKEYHELQRLAGMYRLSKSALIRMLVYKDYGVQLNKKKGIINSES